jgi:hypothetical protein
MAAHVACFGKLPFHREFLRLGLDSPAAAWTVRWVEQAHAAWSRAGNAPATSPLVRFAAPVERSLVAGVVRQSGDGLRRHPITLFVEAPGEVAARPELVPLACAPVWTALAALLDGGAASVGELSAALAAGVAAPDVATAARIVAEGDARDVPGGAWAALAGASDADGSRHLALNLVTAVRAQAEAASAADGVAVALPVDDDPAAAAVRASRWLALFAAAVGRATAPPVLLMRAEPGLLVAFHRPPEGRDLAAVLSDPGLAPIDDLREPWQPWPPDDPRLAAGVDALVRGGPDRFPALVDAVRRLVAP